MSTVTTFDEKTGKYIVKDSQGNVVGTGSSWKEAGQKSQEYNLQTNPVTKGQTAYISDERGQRVLQYEEGKPPSGPEIIQPISEAASSSATLTPREAYIAGIISKNALQSAERSGMVFRINKEDMKSWTQYRQAHPGLETMYTPETHSLQSMVAWKSNMETINRQDQAADLNKLAANPVTQVSYVVHNINPLQAIGTVFEYAALGLSGQSFDTHKLYMNYVGSLYSSPSESINIKAEVFGKQHQIANIPFNAKEAAYMGLGMAGVAFGPSGLLGAEMKILTTTVGKGIYYGDVGLQFAKTFLNPTQENIARTIVYSAPIAFEAGWKGMKFMTVGIPAVEKLSVDLFKTKDVGVSVEVRPNEIFRVSEFQVVEGKGQGLRGWTMEKIVATQSGPYAYDVRTVIPMQKIGKVDIAGSMRQDFGVASKIEFNKNDYFFSETAKIAADFRPGAGFDVSGPQLIQRNLQYAESGSLSEITKSFKREAVDVSIGHGVTTAYDKTSMGVYDSLDFRIKSGEISVSLDRATGDIGITPKVFMEKNRMEVMRPDSVFSESRTGIMLEMPTMEKALPSIKPSMVEIEARGPRSEVAKLMGKPDTYFSGSITPPVSMSDIISQSYPAVTPKTEALSIYGMGMRDLSMSAVVSMPDLKMDTQMKLNVSMDVSLRMDSAIVQMNMQRQSIGMASIQDNYLATMPSLDLNMRAIRSNVGGFPSASNIQFKPSFIAPSLPSMPQMDYFRRKKPIVDFKPMKRDYAYVPSFWGMLVEMPRFDMKKVLSGMEIRGI